MYFEFAVAVFATWRLSRFIRKENGPLNFMSGFSGWATKTFQNSDGSDEGTFAEMISCHKCLSFWLSIGVSYLWWHYSGNHFSPGIWCMMPWAISACVIGLDYCDGMYAVRAKKGFFAEDKFDQEVSCQPKECDKKE